MARYFVDIVRTILGNVNNAHDYNARDYPGQSSLDSEGTQAELACMVSNVKANISIV